MHETAQGAPSIPPSAPPLLTVEDLRIEFRARSLVREVVRGISFRMGREKIGIVGESGSGKSLTARALIDLVPAPGKVSARQMSFDGLDLARLAPPARAALRGKRIAMVMQDPRFSLNPVMTIGAQIAETFRFHHRLDRKQARLRTLEALESVRIRDPERVFDAYPHQISGGMGQRAMIAMMLAPEPDLLIADEPTSALDASVERGVLATLDALVTSRNMGLILISHDIDLVAAFCDRILVLYAGKLVEEFAAVDLHKASHPYTRGLMACVPRLGAEGGALPTIERDPAWA